MRAGMIRGPQRGGKELDRKSHHYHLFLALFFFGGLYVHSFGSVWMFSDDKTSTTIKFESGIRHDQEEGQKVVQDEDTYANVTLGTNLHYDEKPPLFIIHIGPLKTATTTFQCYAGQHMSQLAQDNFYFIGFISARQDSLGCPVEKGFKEILGKESHFKSTFRRNFRKCATACNCGNDLWKQFEMQIEYHYDRHHNVLYSNEILSLVPRDCEDFWDRLRAMLENWRVRIFFTYRRHYEWELSSYHEVNNAEVDVFVERWPTNKTDSVKRLQSIPEYIKQMKKRADHYSLDMIQKWKTLFGKELWVLNYHQGGDIISNAFCQMIPEASNTCASFKASSSGTIVQNKGSEKAHRIHIDRMATEAYDRGWLKNTAITRSMARNAIESRLGDPSILSRMNNVSLDCLAPEEKKVLLNKSLVAEAELFPEFFASEKGEREVRSRFSQVVEKKKFCSVDVNTVLDTDDWESFFKSL